jgi:hypothetical protein
MINYDWVLKSTISKDQLSSFCTTSKEVEFCWWVSDDIGESDWCYNEIINLISRAKAGDGDQWRGNTYQLNFYPKKMVLEQSNKNSSNEFDLVEFEKYLVKWRFECEKRGVVFQ